MATTFLIRQVLALCDDAADRLATLATLLRHHADVTLAEPFQVRSRRISRPSDSMNTMTSFCHVQGKTPPRITLFGYL